MDTPFFALISSIPYGCFSRQGLAFPSNSPAERFISVYILPIVLAAFAIALITWRLNQRDTQRLTRELKASQDLAAQREKERDLAQEEVFRRLYEDRELNKE